MTLLKQIRMRRAEHWLAEAEVHRGVAATLKAVHDKHVKNGGSVSLAQFDDYATAIGYAEECERKAARWQR